MNIQALWRSFYAEKSPLAFLLREQMPERWLRVHSLPRSKRYAHNQDEAREVLRRYNCVASEVLDEAAPCALFFPGYARRVVPAVFDPLDRQFFYRFRTEILRLAMFTAQTRWQSHKFEALLCRVADDEVRFVLWMNLGSGEIFAPYDGGADLFLSSTERRDALRARYAPWLSAHPEGL